jgi:hypothetical protein
MLVESVLPKTLSGHSKSESGTVLLISGGWKMVVVEKKVVE